MLFNSFTFVGLVVATLCIYYAEAFLAYQVHILIASSLIFYSWGNPYLTIILLVSILINIIASFYIAKNVNRKVVAFIGIILNIAILCYFKYAGFISFSLFKDSCVGKYLLAIPLPLGISFFTFKSISLLVDTYKDANFAEQEISRKSFTEHCKNTFLFISFFPQLVSGPIVKARDFFTHIEPKKIKDVNLDLSFREIVSGYFFKMVVADNLKDFTFWIAYPHFKSKDTLSLLSMMFGFSCQLYADFAGYSLIANGIARLFGYNLIKNFNFPYISSSFQEFWRRWHISLSEFLKEYLYIPLGGNRKGKFRTYINIMITMIFGGLWHGASWNYALWGCFHGVALSVERIVNSKCSFNKNFIAEFLKIILVFSLVSTGWLFFKLAELNHVIEYLKSIKNNMSIDIDIFLIVRVFLYSSPIAIHHLYYILRMNRDISPSEKDFFCLRNHAIFDCDEQWNSWRIYLFSVLKLN